jgi:hypothetical protein
MQPHGSQSRHKDLLPKFAAALDLFLPEVKFAGEGLKTSATLRSSDGHTKQVLIFLVLLKTERVHLYRCNARSVLYQSCINACSYEPYILYMRSSSCIDGPYVDALLVVARCILYSCVYGLVTLGRCK